MRTSYIFTLIFTVAMIAVGSIATAGQRGLYNDFPMSIYVADSLPYMPRGYVIFDHIEHGFVMSQPWMGGLNVDYVAGKWFRNGDTIIARPDIEFGLNREHGSFIDTIAFETRDGEAILDLEYKFLTKGDTIFDITDKYIFSPFHESKDPTFFPFRLVHGETVGHDFRIIRK